MVVCRTFMAKKPSLFDEVLASSKNMQRSRTWFDRVPQDLRSELLGLRKVWQSGDTGLTKRALGRQIIASLEARGVTGLGIQGVTSWLSAKS